MRIRRMTRDAARPSFVKTLTSAMMAPAPLFSEVRLKRWLRILGFRAKTEDYADLDVKDLGLGLFATWLVGVGRYWDDSKAQLAQHLGLGSLAYVFVLGTLLWLICKPAMPEKVSWFGILVFVTMTSPPAAFYAIPVELWMSLESANQINLIFLCIVALWRVLLYLQFLSRGVGMNLLQTFVCGIMPIAVILGALVALNLHHVVFNIMGGIREADKTSQDATYGMMWFLSIVSIPVSAACGLVWIGIVLHRLSRPSR
jgi:hypothetical protein